MDSFWTTYSDYIVGIPTLVISTVVAVWVFIKQKNKKSLEYRIRANESLLSYEKGLENGIIVSYENVEITNLALMNIEFINTGNKEILKNDFYDYIAINFYDNKILNVNLEHSENVNISFTYDHNQIKIFPTIINPKIRFSFKILFDQKEGLFKPKPTGVIAGIKEIREIKDSTWKELFWIIPLASLITVILIQLILSKFLWPIPSLSGINLIKLFFGFVLLSMPSFFVLLFLLDGKIFKKE